MQLSFAFKDPDAKVALVTIEQGVPNVTSYRSLTEMRFALLSIADTDTVAEQFTKAGGGPEDVGAFTVTSHLQALRCLRDDIDTKIAAIEQSRKLQ